MRILVKECSKCHEEKPVKSFFFDKSKSDGLYSSCSDCHKKLRDNDPVRKIRDKERQLKMKYGITLQEYNEMNETQRGCCAICGGKNKNGWSLAVDHDHRTGEIRKLLCASCNVILGTAYDDVKILKSAIEYLEEYK